MICFDWIDRPQVESRHPLSINRQVVVVVVVLAYASGEEADDELGGRVGNVEGEEESEAAHGAISEVEELVALGQWELGRHGDG